MMTCLVIDDSRLVRQVSRRIVEDLGFDCAEAEDGKHAFELCQEFMPDLVIVDWNMPVMSGLEFVEKLRDMENGGHPKVIFCTTEDNLSHIERALRAGATEYIMKPFNRDMIQAKLIQIGLMQEAVA
ncbi:MAG: response regulator [Micavibrio aeruginosavorus]|uniref:Response regulator n=1 Tax=Micavibrio aeruginosavorus TaxID=349221 RepID=A0A7T5UHH1_9BACT|nr:MAG: response regulator [Micavibrio aeruginosavorus]